MAGKFYLMRKADLQKFLDSLSRGMTVFVPARDGKDFRFKPLVRGGKVELEGYINTAYPPKFLLLPEGDTLLEYSGGRVSERFQEREQAIFGIRPCDVHAISVLDKVMLGHEFHESHYGKRRQKTVIIALDCSEAGENCFCESMGTRDPEGGFDILLTGQGGSFHVETGSEKGERLISSNRRLFRETGQKAGRKKLACRKSMDTSNLPGIMKDMRGSPLWDDVARRCVSCASCTYSCPTCYCYSFLHDSDMGDAEKGKVLMEHDYCMLPRFTKVAGGGVFREPRRDRVKQFFYHKLLYGMLREGKYHCVGCGRCITECMANIDITEEVKRIREEHGRKGA